MFWDSSALVPLLLPEPRSAELASLLRKDRAPAIWWASPVECQSAIYRRHRKAALLVPQLDQALERLQALVANVDTVAPTSQLRQRAARLLATHPIHAADALQLAAALDWCAEQPAQETFISLDERLREAARREGFVLLPS